MFAQGALQGAAYVHNGEEYPGAAANFA